MRVQQIWRHPVKSAAGEQLEHADVDHLGVVGDRRAALRDERTGLTLTARRDPVLLHAAPVWQDDGTVAVRLPDGTVTDRPDALSAWLGRPVRLVTAAEDDAPATYEIAVDDDGEHQTAPDVAGEGWDGTWSRWTGPSAVFHDSTRTQVSLIAAPALGEWDVRRFRPNLVLDVGDERELIGRRIAIGDVLLDVVKQIDRCVVVTRPQPGLDRDPQVLRRVLAERDGCLGVGAMVAAPGRLSVGDEVRLI